MGNMHNKWCQKSDGMRSEKVGKTKVNKWVNNTIRCSLGPTGIKKVLVICFELLSCVDLNSIGFTCFIERISTVCEPLKGRWVLISCSSNAIFSEEQRHHAGALKHTQSTHHLLDNSTLPTIPLIKFTGVSLECRLHSSCKKHIDVKHIPGQLPVCAECGGWWQTRQNNRQICSDSWGKQPFLSHIQTLIMIIFTIIQYKKECGRNWFALSTLQSVQTPGVSRSRNAIIVTVLKRHTSPTTL